MRQDLEVVSGEATARANLDFEGPKNIRDFGGIVNKEGRVIKSHCFLRANALAGLTKNDIARLQVEYNVKTVIDLRTQTEVSEKPDKVIPGVRQLNIPIFQEAVAGITHEKGLTQKKDALVGMPEFEELYALMVREEYSRGQFRRVFEEILAKPDGECMLWHCTEGKDRCGLVSALLLCLLDVDRANVYEDYMLTATVKSENAQKYYWLIRLVYHDKPLAEKMLRICAAKPAYLDSAFAQMERDFGSVDGFIREALGISDEMKRAFKEKCLE